MSPVLSALPASSPSRGASLTALRVSYVWRKPIVKECTNARDAGESYKIGSPRRAPDCVVKKGLLAGEEELAVGAIGLAAAVALAGVLALAAVVAGLAASLAFTC